MGLAASQARFLGITARKSNIEYEGQQVNQQRTALAEEVNALYSKLLSLKVPVAPDTTEFYESNYSFSISDKTNNQDGNYIVKNYYENDDGSYYMDVERTYDKNMAEQSNLSNQWKIVKSEDGTYSLVNIKDETSYALSLSSDPTEIKSLIDSTAGIQPLPEGTQNLYTYKDSDGKTHYIPDVQVTGYDPAAEQNSIYSYMKTNKTVTETTTFDNVQVTFDGNNRMSSITIPGVVSGLDVDTTRTYDSEGYDAALRDYTMSKDEYDKMVADLNAQTESLQQEDKVLELRLNQIDTEQNELQTELEAVKAVLDKNIENTFNTFS